MTAPNKSQIDIACILIIGIIIGIVAAAMAMSPKPTERPAIIRKDDALPCPHCHRDSQGTGAMRTGQTK